jgi:hypothetical protein
MKIASFPRRAAVPVLAALLVLVFAACGGDDESSDSASTSTATSTAAAQGEFAEVKDYLLAHTGPLAGTTAELSEQAQQYYDLAKEENFDYEALLSEHREEVSNLVTQMQGTWRKANPQYEEAEGVVAGVPELADYDVILDAGSSAEDDPESAVPFDLKRPDGEVEKRPGNFFYLTETALWGTEDKFAAESVEADLDDDGKVEFGEALPEANHLAAATRDMAKYAKELDASSKGWSPTESDVFTALVVMTPTMSEYFGAWKNSRFVAGSDASEASFVGTSRLSDITDILSGLVLVYDGIRPRVAEGASEAQAEQTGRSLARLRDFAADLRDREQGGEQFTAEQADTFGSEAQARAEAIAGQVSQAAGRLNVQLET